MSAPLIGTHNGHFHADEALAVYLLRMLPAYRDSTLVRTRDPSKLDQCHTVVDVHGKYSANANLFDHHQREFNTTFPGHETKLSSAGLVYMHFGRDIIAQVTGLPKDSEDADVLYNKLYDCFVEAFDANDNGISQYDTARLTKSGIEKRFDDSGYSLASVVNRYNRHYEDDAGKSPEQLQLEEDQRFLKASTFVGEQFFEELQDKWKAWLPARKSVEQSFVERKKYDEQGRIMVLSEGMPWADHLYQLEKASGEPDQNQVLYVLFPESQEADSKWRIRAVSVENAGFTNRKDLPDAWKGVRDEELDKISGVPGCVFVHASGFIGGNKTFDGALQMAQKAVKS
ncbi:metal-dependent protein hydrolase [Viridothelium virens]|uniref:Metal-dependent protein hydrolase n=1 Tax=Viridothelium virens TaxID=1048519 RepID=A0A6A6H815_VIRVR|nr:metal-dependent protein hydrolase [Viridothelium virens]